MWRTISPWWSNVKSSGLGWDGAVRGRARSRARARVNSFGDRSEKARACCSPAPHHLTAPGAAALGDGARARERIGGVRAERGARREERARVLDRPQRAQPRDEARDVRRQAITDADKKSELVTFGRDAG